MDPIGHLTLSELLLKLDGNSAFKVGCAHLMISWGEATVKIALTVQ
jgi:hypothetical protein